MRGDAGLSEICVCEITLAPRTILPFFCNWNGHWRYVCEVEATATLTTWQKMHIWSDRFYWCHINIMQKLLSSTETRSQNHKLAKNCQKGKHVFSDNDLEMHMKSSCRFPQSVQECQRNISWKIMFRLKYALRLQFVANSFTPSISMLSGMTLPNRPTSFLSQACWKLATWGSAYTLDHAFGIVEVPSISINVCVHVSSRL